MTGTELTREQARQNFLAYLQRPNSDLTASTMRACLSAVETACKNELGYDEAAQAYITTILRTLATSAAEEVKRRVETHDASLSETEAQETLGILTLFAPDLARQLLAKAALTDPAAAADLPVPDPETMTAGKGDQSPTTTRRQPPSTNPTGALDPVAPSSSRRRGRPPGSKNKKSK